MFKKIVIILLCLAALCLMCACGSEQSSTVRSDIPAADISTSVESAISSEGLIQVEDSYILGRMQIDTSKCSDYVVKITSIGTAIDEYGIFRAADEASAKEISEQVQAYLDRYLASWMDEYRPEEKPKLQAADIHTEGVYVFYTIMADTDADAALAALHSLIK